MRIYRVSGKTWKDQKEYDNVILYHVSHEHLYNLAPRSKFWGYKGLFMSPSYKSTIRDWAYYVMGKKSVNHPLKIQWGKLNDEMTQVEDEIERLERLKSSDAHNNDQKELKDNIEKLHERLEKINNTRDKISDSMQEDSHQEATRGYKTLYIHKIYCPKSIYKQATELFHNAYAKGYMEGSLGFWGWGEQIFIIDKWLPHLEIISVEKKTIVDLLDAYSEMGRTPFDRASIGDPNLGGWRKSKE